MSISNGQGMSTHIFICNNPPLIDYNDYSSSREDSANFYRALHMKNYNSCIQWLENFAEKQKKDNDCINMLWECIKKDAKVVIDYLKDKNLIQEKDLKRLREDWNRMLNL